MASRAASRLAPFARQLRPRAARAATSFRAPICSPNSSSSFRQAIAIRAAHTIPRPPAPEQPSSSAARENSKPKPDDEYYEDEDDAPTSEGPRPEIKNPAYYQLSFTCLPCGHRSHHNVSKQAYHKGATLISCPECRNRHVISDHLGIFGDRKLTIEDIMREKGQLVKRGSLGEDGDIEFWPEEDGTEQADKTGKE